MDCDDAVLTIAAAEARTLSGVEEARLHAHLETCETCRQASTAPSEENWRWLVRASGDAVDAAGLVIPVVDPSVFEIEGEVATGGMGRILRARDRRLGRVIAIKEVLGPELRERFQREALITARLQHPAIVPIYEAGTWPDGSGFYTMRLVPGGTLQQSIDRARDLPARLGLLHHVIAVTEAVAYAHAHGIIHRDLKPGNVLVGELGETVVIDWGLAKELDAADDLTGEAHDRAFASGLTRAGAVLGTPGFMAPEQARGEVLDPRADVFALGAILYSVLVGAPPYADEYALAGAEAVIALAALRPPRAIEELAPEAPADLHAIVRRATAWAREDRYPTAREMVEELRRFEAGKLLARQYGVAELIGRWIRRHRAAVAVGVIALLVIAGLGTYAIVNVTRSRAAARDARDVSETNLAALLEEQGRTEVQAGNHDRALAYLDGALARGRDTVPLRHLLGVALRDRPQDLLQTTLAFDSDVDALAFTPAGELVTLTEAGELSIWQGSTRAHRHDVGKLDMSWFDVDAKTAITLGKAMRLEAWDPRTGTRRWSLDGAAGFEDGVVLAFSPDKATVAVADRTAGAPLVVLDIVSGARRVALSNDAHAVVAIAYSDDGTRLAAIDQQGRLRVWNAATFALEVTVTTSPKRPHLAFHGADLLVVAGERRAEVWRLAPSPQVIASIEHDAPVARLATHAGAGLVATSDDRGVVRVFTPTGTLVGASYAARSIRWLAFSPDGMTLLGTGTDSQTYAWRTRPLHLLRGFEVANESFGAVAWSHDGRRLASYATDLRVRVWAAPRGNLEETVAATRLGVADDRWIATTNDAATVRRFDGAIVANLPSLRLRRAAASNLDASADGERALVAVGEERAADTVRYAVISLRDGKRVAEVVAEQASLSRDGTRVGALDVPLDKAGRARLIDATTGTTLAEAQFPVDGPQPARAAVALDGRLIVFEGKQPLALPELGARAPIVKLGFVDIDGARLDPTGRRVVAWRWSDWQLVVHDLQTGARIAAWQGPQYVKDVVFSRDGERMALQAKDQVEVHDVANPLATVTVGHVVEGAFALDTRGSRLAVGHADGTISIVDATRGGVLEVLRGHTTQVKRVAFSADGAHLLGFAGDGTVTRWKLGLDTRTGAEFAALAKTSSWKLVGGVLVRAR